MDPKMQYPRSIAVVSGGKLFAFFVAFAKSARDSAA
jgi:hypothetical protein